MAEKRFKSSALETIDHLELSNWKIFSHITFFMLFFWLRKFFQIEKLSPNIEFIILLFRFTNFIWIEKFPPIFKVLAIFRNEIATILTLSTLEGGEWRKWGWSHFPFWSSLGDYKSAKYVNNHIQHFALRCP